MKIRQALLTGTALAFAGGLAAGPALAADKMSLGVHGYMEQWVGMADVNGDDDNKEGAFEVKSDAEIHFRGTLKADNGLTFSVNVELEANNMGNQGPNKNETSNMIDESYLKITGDFGDIRIGSEDTASNLMHYGHKDVGIGLTAGDTKSWLGFGTPNTYGDKQAYFGDSMKVSYFTPRMEGVQLGLSYMPDGGTHQAKNNSADNNDMDAWSVGLNYMGAIGDSSVAFSAGHYSQSTAGDDDATTTNFGLQVGMGAFGFNIAYAQDDDGAGAENDTVTGGIIYTDGPMAVSGGYAMLDRGAGDDMTSGMLSLSYVLAPGVSSNTSLFMAEDGDMDGTGFVTGFKVGF